MGIAVNSKKNATTAGAAAPSKMQEWRKTEDISKSEADSISVASWSILMMYKIDVFIWVQLECAICIYLDTYKFKHTIHIS